MISINCLSSGSHGNCYHVTDGSSPLLLEAGIRFSEIREGIGFKTSQLAGCLISHEHGDHSKSTGKLMRAGVDCYLSSGSARKLNLSGHRVHLLHHKQQKVISDWIVVPFKTEHDAAEPLGFLLENMEGERLVYITDSFYSQYTFPGLTHIMVECNYALDILNKNIESGRVHPGRKERVLKSHFSLKNVKDFLRANDLSKVQEIWLLHLSNDNSDGERFKTEIQKLTGKPVYVAGG
ncbi:MAG: MBL fold metallo-hydrolase [bacterium]